MKGFIYRHKRPFCALLLITTFALDGLIVYGKIHGWPDVVNFPIGLAMILTTLGSLKLM